MIVYSCSNFSAFLKMNCGAHAEISGMTIIKKKVDPMKERDTHFYLSLSLSYYLHLQLHSDFF